jgi:hypothetical protein
MLFFFVDIPPYSGGPELNYWSGDYPDGGFRGFSQYLQANVETGH